MSPSQYQILMPAPRRTIIYRPRLGQEWMTRVVRSNFFGVFSLLYAISTERSRNRYQPAIAACPPDRVISPLAIRLYCKTAWTNFVWIVRAYDLRRRCATRGTIRTPSTRTGHEIRERSFAICNRKGDGYGSWEADTEYRMRCATLKHPFEAVAIINERRWGDRAWVFKGNSEQAWQKANVGSFWYHVPLMN